MAKILVNLTHGPEELEQAEMALKVANILVDEGHTVTVLLAEEFFQLVHEGAADLPSEVCQSSLRDYYTTLVRQGAKIELSGPPLKPTRRRSKQFKPLPGFAVPEALLRLSVGQDRIFTY
jgi:predicted peroxiredoxin